MAATIYSILIIYLLYIQYDAELHICWQKDFLIQQNFLLIILSKVIRLNHYPKSYTSIYLHKIYVKHIFLCVNLYTCI